MASSSSSGGGVGILGLLGVAFVILKLTGAITWPWIWVLAPFWVAFLIGVVIVVVFVVGLVIAAAVGSHNDKKRAAESRASYKRF